MAQIAGQIPTNSQSHAPTTDESGYFEEDYLNNLTSLGTRPSVQQFNGNNNATRVINGQQGQEEAEDALSDISEFDEEWEELVQQMQQVLVAFILPWLGRWLGRKFSFWAWSRFVEWYYYPRITTIKAKIETTETTISSRN